MKKFLSISMAAVCALAAASFGIAACSSDGDEESSEVSSSGWSSAMSGSIDNVTANITSTLTDKLKCTDGSSLTTTCSESAEIKLAFSTAADSGKTTGNTYLNYGSTKKIVASDGTNSSSTITSSEGYTTYEVFTYTSYSYITKDSDDNITGYQSDSGGLVSTSEAYIAVNILSEYKNSFSYFEYSDGAYTRTKTDTDGKHTYTFKFSNGKVTYFSEELSYTDSGSGYTETYSEKYEYSFSDYGSTKVTVPEEYTYEYNFGSDDDEKIGNVTWKEWKAALSVENLYNVTVSLTDTETDVFAYTDGSKETGTYSETATVKLDIGVTSGIVGGYMYRSSEISDSLYNSEEYSYTRYDAFEADWSYVSKTTNADGDSWNGNLRGGYTWRLSELVLYGCYTYDMVNVFEGLEDFYYYAEYSNGKYVITDDDYTYEIKIVNGYVTYLSIECAYTDSGSGYTETYSEKCEYSFSNYGSTTISIPDEYTYSYYNANN